MTSEQWRQIEELYHSVRERTPADRAALLAQADPEVRREVEAMLAQDASGKILDEPAKDLLTDSRLTTVAAGSRLGPFQIEALLGVGGMGKVYRAVDTRLDRKVAIKISTEQFIARFEREARAISALNHPHICTLYDVGPNYLVMELVEGETLAAKLRKGKLSIDDTLLYGGQIAAALAEAHSKGITHRDLKPGNVMIGKNGVKVLDFGLAKSAGDQALTASNVVMGSPAYMAPEQLEGKGCDPRTDIYALGLMLHEMATGKRSIPGQIPPMESVPEKLQHVIQRCLAKDPEERWQSARDVNAELEWMARIGTKATRPPKAAGVRRIWSWVAAAGVLGAAVATGFQWRYSRPAQDPPEMRVEINTPSTSAPGEFALSPDGRYIVFVASGDGPQRLWLRALDKTAAQPLAGTEGADDPFWSPDSRSIGFHASLKLKRIDIGGGSPQVLASSSIFGGAWNADGTILFNTAVGAGPLSRINASGGDPAPVTRLGSQQVSNRFPNFLPDGRHFLFYAVGTSEATGIYLASLDGGEPKRLTAADSAGVYLAPEMIVFGSGTTLMARHLDLKRAELTGEPVKLADFAASPLGLAGLSMSSDGWIAYRSSGEAAQRQLKWYDRNGKSNVAAGGPDAASLLYPELSPDGRQVVVARTVQGNQDIWLVDLVRGGMTRFTFDPAADSIPIWSPDGMRIAFASNRKGSYNIYVKPSSGAGTEELVLQTSNNKWTQDWSKDGRFLLYVEADAKNGTDLWALPVTGREAQARQGAAVNDDRKPIAVAKAVQSGQFSPDGHWVAYETSESGEFQIVVQPFPEPTGKWQVSTGGGTQPRWRADGKELYFIAPDGKLMAASMTVQGSTFAAGTPVALFPAPPVTGGAAAVRQQYAVSRDGRFLINQPAEAATPPPPITLILNWRPKP